MGKKKIKNSIVSEPAVDYKKRELRFFNSFKEQEEYELEQMAQFSSEEILQQMRQLINLSYGMHGYNPDKLPQKHSIRIIPYNPK